jgi:hypothetical protein
MSTATTDTNEDRRDDEKMYQIRLLIENRDVKALQEHGYIEFLVASLKHHDVGLRSLAAELLVRSGDSRAVEAIGPLITCSKDACFKDSDRLSEAESGWPKL